MVWHSEVKGRTTLDREVEDNFLGGGVLKSLGRQAHYHLSHAQPQDNPLRGHHWS
jgi:hypothetical protein